MMNRYYESYVLIQYFQLDQPLAQAIATHLQIKFDISTTITTSCVMDDVIKSQAVSLCAESFQDIWTMESSSEARRYSELLLITLDAAQFC